MEYSPSSLRYYFCIYITKQTSYPSLNRKIQNKKNPSAIHFYFFPKYHSDCSNFLFGGEARVLLKHILVLLNVSRFPWIN